MRRPSSNDRPGFFGPARPLYPPLRQTVRVAGGGSPAPGFVQQYAGNVPRDREACWVFEPNGIALPPGGHVRPRLVGAHDGGTGYLPLFAACLACCVPATPFGSS